MFFAFNPDSIDCIIETFTDPAQRVFLSLCFFATCDCAFEIDFDVLSQISRLSKDQIENAFREFARKNVIFYSDSRSAVYESLDRRLEGEQFSIPQVFGDLNRLEND